MHSNTLWYLGLSLISVVVVCFAWRKSKTYRSLLFFLAMTNIIYLIDTVNYIFLSCYQFYPEFTRLSEWVDSDLGGMTSNFLSLPAAAMAIAVFKLSWAWILAISGMFVGIEWLFLKLDIYRHNWWRLSYSAIGFPAYFTLAKSWFPKFMQPQKGFLQFVTLYLITAAMTANVQIVIPVIFLGNRLYHIGWFKDPYHDSDAFASVLFLGYALLYVLTVKLRWKRKWLKYLVLITLLYLVISFLKKVGIQHSYVWWDTWYGLSVTFLQLLAADAISKRLWNGSAVK